MIMTNAAYIIDSDDPEYVHDELVSRVGDVITRFRDDLMKHDLRGIANHPGRSFIHVCYDSATHIYFMAQPGDDLSEIMPIALGKGTADNYHHQILAMLDNPGTFERYGSDIVYTYYNFDTATMYTVDSETAATIYRNALTTTLNTSQVK